MSCSVCSAVVVFENLIVFPREIQLPQDVLISKVSRFFILHKKEDTEKEIRINCSRTKVLSGRKKSEV